MVFPAKPGSQKRPRELLDADIAHTSANGDIPMDPFNSNAQAAKRKRVFDFDAHPRRKIALQFLYYGWEFDGLVQQVNTDNTVEKHLLTALLKTKLISSEKDCDFSRCGRTDKGVSAFRQIAAVVVRSADPTGKFVFWSETTEKSIIDNYPKKEELSYLKMLNGVLPNNISVTAWAAVPRDFSARHACNMRIYKYSFPKANLDIEAMRRAGALFVGTHDFRNFCQLPFLHMISSAPQPEYICKVILYMGYVIYFWVDMNEKRVTMSFIREIFEINIEVLPSSSDTPSRNDLIELTIKGSGFLWHMIRYIVTVLHEIGQENEDPELVSALLDVERTPCRPHYTLAVATPLCLYECKFDLTDLEWIYDEFALRKTVANLQSQWADFQTKARIIDNMITGLMESSHDVEVNLDRGLLEFTQDRVLPAHYVKFANRKTCDSLEQKLEKLKKKKSSLESPAQPFTSLMSS